MDSRKQLTAGEIEELKEEIRTMPHKEFFGENLQPLVDDHSRLLSLLTPPPDAAVREAVEYLAACCDEAGETKAGVYRPFTMSGTYARTLLRAVQARRLTGEQVEAEAQPLIPAGAQVTIHIPPMPESELVTHLQREIMHLHKDLNRLREAAELRAAMLKQGNDGLSSLCEQLEARVRELERALSDEQHDHQQTIRVLTDEIQRMKAENALIADSYKRAHDEVILLRRQLNSAGVVS